MKNINTRTGGSARAAPLVQDSNSLLVHLHCVGLVFCLSVSMTVHAQATSPSDNARGTLNRTENMTALNTVDALRTTPSPATPKDDQSIRPFHVHFSDEALADLRRRVQATNWPDRETVNDPSQGVQLATIQNLAKYWATSYDWRKVEARLNALPQFVTTIDGLDIHFIHVRSAHKNALPMIITHGWPGSIIEQMKIIDPLTNPTAHGAKAEDAFDVVIPSMPGYGFSGKPTSGGWDAVHIARAWAELMKRLGYTRYVAQGGDWGAVVTEMMALQTPPGLIGIHVNMPGAIPVDIDKAAASGAAAPPGLSAEERHAYDQLAFVYTKGIGYAYQLGLHPQTMIGIADSPVGLAAYLIDHDLRSYEMIARVFAGEREGLTRDDLLDNITLTWLTGTGISSGRLYWENKQPFFSVKGVTLPVAVSAFPDELYQTPRSWAERAFPKLIFYHKLDKGGHFAAWEQPQLLTEDLREGLRSLRSTNSASR
ncbi:MAG: Multidrug transporter [Gemmatimonadetes bacterium]|nr:Multidrug transporter [Gemmatimonadota bacterium]